MQIKFKKLNESAVIPKIPRLGDAGIDLVATSYSVDEFGNHVYGTGLASEFPENYVGLIFPRSSISKYSLSLANSVGVLDSTYRGEIMLKFKFHQQTSQNLYKVGEKVAQLIFVELPKIEILEAQELSETDRGAGGFGSTGK